MLSLLFKLINFLLLILVFNTNFLGVVYIPIAILVENLLYLSNYIIQLFLSIINFFLVITKGFILILSQLAKN